MCPRNTVSPEYCPAALDGEPAKAHLSALSGTSPGLLGSEALGDCTQPHRRQCFTVRAFVASWQSRDVRHESCIDLARLRLEITTAEGVDVLKRP